MEVNQLVFPAALLSAPRSEFAHTLLIPSACALLSMVLLFLHVVLIAGPIMRFVAGLRGRTVAEDDNGPLQPISSQHASFFSSLRPLIKEHGGGLIFAWKMLRLLACMTLTALTIVIVISRSVNEGCETADAKDVGANVNTPSWWAKKDRKTWACWFSMAEWIEISFCMFYTYNTLLAILALTLGPRLRAVANFHLVVLLPAAFGVHAWRDLLPYATFELQPTDAAEGWLTWSRIGVLTFASIVVPLCIPRPYSPLDPNDSSAPNPEQTAPLVSLLLYNFLDPIAWTAYRSPKLDYDQLPPLADYDRASYLKQCYIDKLDPRQTKRRHLFKGLTELFWKDYCIMALMIVIKGLTGFSRPLCVRYLLLYLQNPSEPGYIRPWVWVAGMFLGPVIGSIAMQRYYFVGMRLLDRTKGIITQLLYEHLFRMRLVGDEANFNRSNLVGKIINQISADLRNIVEGRDFLNILVFTPMQLCVCTVFLYRILGWSAIIGMIVLLLSSPIPVLITQLVHGVQVERMNKADSRVQTITEVMSLIRMIKLFGWESKVRTSVEKKREEELVWHKKKLLWGLLSMNANYILPLAVVVITFASHTLWFKKPLDASTVFSSLGVFEILRNQLFMLSKQIPLIVQAKVSLDRIDEFLNETELLDIHTEDDTITTSKPGPPSPGSIGFRNGTLTWTRQVHPKQSFSLKIEGEVLFHRGKINMVIGPTGCGKTSLVRALLGQMQFKPDPSDSWVSLPQAGSVAYAAQEAWLQNATIRDNILFGMAYDEERYMKVINQCALEKDLAQLNAGDQTEVGEQGATLSGGQNARVSLARAIYSTKEIVILDDVLSALDVKTSRWILNNCFRGDLVADRVLIIVTHSMAMPGDAADYYTITLSADGRASSLSPKSNAQADRCQDLGSEGEQAVGSDLANNGAQGQRASNSDGKLMLAEEVAVGHVGWPALKLFLGSLGGAGFWLMYAAGFILANVTVLVQTYWLGLWAQAYNNSPKHPDRVSAPFYLGVYVVFCLLGVILLSGTFAIHVSGSIRASRHIHDRLVMAVIGAPLYWADSTPIGRVIARFTQDMRAVDSSLPNEMQSLVAWTIQLLSRFIGVVVLSPAFAPHAVVVFLAGIWVCHVYIIAQLSVKREMSNACSPLFSHFSTTLQGITSIRAYGAEQQFQDELLKRIDNYMRAARTCHNLNFWIAIRMSTLGAIFAAGLASYIVYFHGSVDASAAGFSLNMAATFSSDILWWVRTLSEFEVQCNSLERIHEYLQIEQEPEAVPEKFLPSCWPASGNLVVENMTARYSKDGPAVLHDISFKIKSGERVGVVGRTGSGKSSLMLSLLRMIPIEGNVYYDGIPTHAISLDALRSNITIIPQQPELMSGTVRQNLDPFGEHDIDDATLNAALCSAGLKAAQSENDEGYIGLESGVSDGGSNFSLGQRQMLALARAIVRKSKVLILDEATAAIDCDTDRGVQSSIRNELKDLTLIIVAHRLRTVCDADKIMVLEAGKIVEFDSPAALLGKDNGVFKSLVDESEDRDALYAMAAKK